MENKRSFLLHIDSLCVLDELTDAQAGKLFKAIKAYHLRAAERCEQDGDTGFESLMDDFLMRVLFAPFKAQFDRDQEKYVGIVERNKSNGLKGGRPQREKPNKATALKRTQEKPNNPVGFSQTQENPDEATALKKSDSNPNNPVGFSQTQENPNKATAFKKTHRNPQKPKKADSDNDSDSDSDSDKESEENKKESAYADKKEGATHVATPSPDYAKFLDWMKRKAPYCGNPKNFTHQITEEEFYKLKERYSGSELAEIIEQIENRKDLRKRYTNLYRTVLNWIKREK